MGQNLVASPHTLTGNDLFEWRGGNPDYGLLHAESGRFLTADNAGLVKLRPTNLGWGQALRRLS
ncbi:hypothetical protein [Actinoplanes sp. GCM10030250]|uniref:hypothetical protein n=1 Tax=Actinoplanes sp. GCM10030250 TaxID=3273376 RepID=UPI00360807CC